MAIELREYQKAPIRKAVRYFRSNLEEPYLIVCPTSWGKSILAAYCAKYIRPEDKLLVVQPTKELLDQNYRKYVMLCDEEEPAGIYSASFGKKQVRRITYATIGSIKDLGSVFKEQGFTKMLIDEAHLYPRKEQSMLGKFLKDSGIRQVLGITATPLKLEQFSEKQGERFDKWSELIMLTNPSPSGQFFKDILYMCQIRELTTKGFWSKLVYERIPFDPSELRLNSTGGEYSEESQMQAYKLNNIRENIYGALNYHSERRHCIVYVPTVEEARMLAEGYPGSYVISGETAKKDREWMISEFNAGNIRVLFNVNVLSCGYDNPKIDMLILAFCTASVTRYYQILGRGVRVHPGKKDCLVVDMGSNVDRFGKVEDIRFVKTDKWRMYGSGGVLLSGIPVGCIGKISEADIERIRDTQNLPTHMDKGKYTGDKIDDIPQSYKRWYLTQFNRPGPIRDSIIRSMEDHVRDTRNEPMAEVMPDGAHAGMPIGMVPKGYLAWYYSSKEWNVTNDNLRRAIEFYYGGIPQYYKRPNTKFLKKKEL